MSIDPTGMRLDDFSINDRGDISLEKKTKSKTDTLTATTTGKSIELSKGILENTTTTLLKTGERIDTNSTMIDSNAKKLFEFASENTSVEFSNTKTDTSSIVSTSHQESTELGVVSLVEGAKQSGAKIIEHDHSHPKNTGPSGFDSKVPVGDAKFAANTDAKLFVYKPGTREYVEYDKKGEKK